jgi:hypothetical protein
MHACAVLHTIIIIVCNNTLNLSFSSVCSVEIEERSISASRKPSAILRRATIGLEGVGVDVEFDEFLESVDNCF